MEEERGYYVCTKEGCKNVEIASADKSEKGDKKPNAHICEDEKSPLNKNPKIEIKKYTNDHVVFDLIGVDVSIANAIRRLLLSDVPTMAVHIVQIWQNTSIIQDEVLSHRIALIPFKVDPKLFKFRNENEDFSDENSLCFSLKVKCTENDINNDQNSLHVYSKDLVWIPLSENQKKLFGENIPSPVEPNIIINKLRPGQEIELKAYLEKGIGRNHAKWSPVCTASYRLLPSFKFSKENPIRGNEAEELKSICPMNVFDVEESEAYPRYPRRCSTCRLCIERFPKQLEIIKTKDHFIFSIESTGCISATELFKEALEVLKNKASTLKSYLN